MFEWFKSFFEDETSKPKKEVITMSFAPLQYQSSSLAQKCKVHWEYQGLALPTNNCNVCWEYYSQKGKSKKW